MSEIILTGCKPPPPPPPKYYKFERPMEGKMVLLACRIYQMVKHFSTNQICTLSICKWASSWDYDTYHIGDQRMLRRACAVLPEPSLFAHMKYWSRGRVQPKNQTSSPTGWLHMHVWRTSLRRTKSAKISWVGSNAFWMLISDALLMPVNVQQ